MVTPHHVSHVTCHVSRDRCHVLGFTCQVAHVTSFSLFDNVVELVGGGSVINGPIPSSFHKHDCTNWTYVNIHVAKKFKAVHCEICGKYFKKNWESRNTCQYHQTLTSLPPGILQPAPQPAPLPALLLSCSSCLPPDIRHQTEWDFLFSTALL